MQFNKEWAQKDTSAKQLKQNQLKLEKTQSKSVPLETAAQSNLTPAMMHTTMLK